MEPTLMNYFLHNQELDFRNKTTLSDSIDKIEKSIQNNFESNKIDELTYIGALDQLDIIKARHGVYKDNKQNQKLHRVGMPYGNRLTEHDHIGKTRSGKYFDIRREHGHEDYKDFTEEDHKDVAEKHGKYLASGKASGETHAYHAAMATKHGESGNKSEKKNKEESNIKQQENNIKSEIKKYSEMGYRLKMKEKYGDNYEDKMSDEEKYIYEKIKGSDYKNFTTYMDKRNKTKT